MTRVEWFEKGFAHDALQLGIISTSVFQKFIKYKIYVELRSYGFGKMEAIREVSVRTKSSESACYKAISFFVNKGSGINR